MFKSQNLNGEKFGKLLVLKETEERLKTVNGRTRHSKTYLCKCDCGNEILAVGSDLVNNIKQSCGCIKIGGKNKKDLVGKRFGKLVVLREDKNRKKKNKKDTSAFWICQCDCGNIKSINGVSLRRGATNGCGCGARLSPENNIMGQNFGKLTVIKRGENTKRGLARWVCQCDCGNEVLVAGNSLRVGRKKSCGCIKENNISRNSWTWRGIGNIPKNYYTTIKNGAMARNLDFAISHRYFWYLYLKQNGECNLSGMKINTDKNNFTASLDRINSDIGYVEGNIQWVHKNINKMKMDFDQKYFIKLCQLVNDNVKNVERD